MTTPAISTSTIESIRGFQAMTITRFLLRRAGFGSDVGGFITRLPKTIRRSCSVSLMLPAVTLMSARRLRMPVVVTEPGCPPLTGVP